MNIEARLKEIKEEFKTADLKTLEEYIKIKQKLNEPIHEKILLYLENKFIKEKKIKEFVNLVENEINYKKIKALRLLEKLSGENEIQKNYMEKNKIILAKIEQAFYNKKSVTKLELIFPESLSVPKEFRNFCNNYLRISAQKSVKLYGKTLIIEIISSPIVYSAIENLLKAIAKQFNFKIKIDSKVKWEFESLNLG